MHLRFSPRCPRIVITSSKNILAPCFLARIVANRETRLFSLFLGLGDKYWQSYDENQTISWVLRESWTKVLLPKSVYILFKSTVYL
jgi:hypothetical protein